MKQVSLLQQIEQAALDDRSDITSALRKCVALGGLSGSEELRAWATRELKGYSKDDVLPEYRTVAAPIAIDGAVYHGHITGQQIRPGALPEPAATYITEELELRMPLAELVEAIKSADDNIVRMGVPGGSDLAALMNHEVRQRDPYRAQAITRIYWQVHVTSLARVIDVVRTTLVELVAEIRAGTPGDADPTKVVTDQAVSVAIYGDKNRVKVVDVSQVHARHHTVEQAERETRAHRLMWWLVGIATMVAATVGALTYLATR